ncbi:response regulator transcription factor [Gryllotalpicola koreensis]|uniref:HTH luxR-type domain-containing protein n=1 Tax=Gryllotalpicola koreensis TaxID=993086 RepID=A0ABP8A069_9MICO
MLPERLETWIEIEYARTLAHTGRLAEAHALVHRLTPIVAAAGDDWASFGLMRARVSVKAASGQSARAEMLARSVALRLEGAAPALAELMLREPRAGVELAASASAVPEAETSDGATERDAVVTPITPALRGLAKVLSGRELLVARLAAAGRTNAQIASELFLSVRTVESHLHHARVKLGVTGREGLAALFSSPGDPLAPAL